MISFEKPENFSPRFEVASCFIQYEDTFVLLHRQSHKPQGNTWGLPAGKIEKGESIITGIVREVYEEIGVKLLPTNVIHQKSVYVHHSGYDFIYHICTYRVDEKPLLTLSTQEHSDYRWVTATEALSMDLIDDEAPCIKMIYQP